MLEYARSWQEFQEFLHWEASSLDVSFKNFTRITFLCNILAMIAFFLNQGTLFIKFVVQLSRIHANMNSFNC